MLFKTPMLLPIMIYVYSLILHNTLFLLHLLCFYALMFHHIIVLLLFVLTHPFEIWTRMGDHHTQYPILVVHYDKDHRAKHLSKLQEDMLPLRLCMHQTHRWDEWYRPYIQRASFLEIVQVFNTGLPILDPALLTAAIDRYDLIHVWWSTMHWFVSLFEFKNFLYWIKNPQVEARDPHLLPSVRRDDYHDVGCEDDSVSAVGSSSSDWDPW
jgi:hypothetical protein